MSLAIDAYEAEQIRVGAFNGPHTLAAYRRVLQAHADDVGNRDPAKTGREDVKRTLSRWPNPNSQAMAHSVLSSFYRWCGYEAIRETNPAEQVRRVRKRAPTVFRPTRAEVVKLIAASNAQQRWSWAVRLGVCAGLRSQELRGLQGRHLAREGWVWVSADIGKGGKERWMPVLGELDEVLPAITEHVGHDDYVLCSRRQKDRETKAMNDRRDTPMSASTLYRMVKAIGAAAGLAGEVTPHTLRHIYGDHVARYAGLRAAQALMGHASVETTASTYTQRPTLDELAVSVQGFRYGELSPQNPVGIHHRQANAR